MMRKQITRAAALLLTLLCLSSCGGPEMIGLIPAYRGLPVKDTTHEFTKEDFFIYASFADGTDRELAADEYEFEVQGLKDGYYLIEITAGDQKQMCYVECEVPVYPSELNPVE